MNSGPERGEAISQERGTAPRDGQEQRHAPAPNASACRGFLVLALLAGLLHEEARLLHFLAAALVWTVDRFVRLGRSHAGPRRRAIARALTPPALVAAAVFALALPSWSALFRMRDAHADRVKRLPQAKLHDGIFHGEADGLRGPIALDVEVREGKRFDVRVLPVRETVGIGGNALEQLRREAAAEGRPPERRITGATLTSQGFREALDLALAESAFGPLELPAHARLFFFLVANRLRLQSLNETALLLLGAAILARIAARPG